MATLHDEGCHEKSILANVLVCKGLSNDDVGAERGAVFQGRYGRELVSKLTISLKKRAIAEPLS